MLWSVLLTALCLAVAAVRVAAQGIVERPYSRVANGQSVKSVRFACGTSPRSRRSVGGGRSGRVLFQSGTLRAEGSIVGVEAEDDPAPCEPRPRAIASSDRPEIQESVTRHYEGGRAQAS